MGWKDGQIDTWDIGSVRSCWGVAIPAQAQLNAPPFLQFRLIHYQHLWGSPLWLPWQHDQQPDRCDAAKSSESIPWIFVDSHAAMGKPTQDSILSESYQQQSRQDQSNLQVGHEFESGKNGNWPVAVCQSVEENKVSKLM